MNSAWRPNLAIDLGTAFTRVFDYEGQLLETPSVIRQRVLSEPDSRDIEVHVLREGFVRHGSAATALLQPILKSMKRFGMIKPRVVAFAPSNASSKQKEELMSVVLDAGASNVDLYPEPLAAALGAGIDIGSEYAQLVVDIGEGITDLAVFREGTMIHTHAFPLACGHVYDAIRTWVFREKGEWLSLEEVRTLVHRTELEPGASVNVQEVQYVIDPMLQELAYRIRDYMKRLPDNIACHIIEDGLTVTGGGATLPGLIHKIKTETCLDVHVPADPSRTLIRGAASLL